MARKQKQKRTKKGPKAEATMTAPGERLSSLLWRDNIPDDWHLPPLEEAARMSLGVIKPQLTAARRSTRLAMGIEGAWLHLAEVHYKAEKDFYAKLAEWGWESDAARHRIYYWKHVRNLPWQQWPDLGKGAAAGLAAERDAKQAAEEATAFDVMHAEGYWERQWADLDNRLDDPTLKIKGIYRAHAGRCTVCGGKLAELEAERDKRLSKLGKPAPADPKEAARAEVQAAQEAVDKIDETLRTSKRTSVKADALAGKTEALTRLRKARAEAEKQGIKLEAVASGTDPKVAAALADFAKLMTPALRQLPYRAERREGKMRLLHIGPCRKLPELRGGVDGDLLLIYFGKGGAQ